MRQIPAHGIGDADSLDGELCLGPDLILTVQQEHVLFVAELTGPVGAKCAGQSNASVRESARFCARDNVGEASYLPDLRSVVVALRKNVAHVDLGGGSAAGWTQRRSELASLLATSLVEGGRRIAHAGLWVKATNDLLNLGHLGCPFWAHKRANGDFLESRLGQSVEQANLVCDGNVPILDLHAITHALFAVVNSGVSSHVLLPEGTFRYGWAYDTLTTLWPHHPDCASLRIPTSSSRQKCLLRSRSGWVVGHRAWCAPKWAISSTAATARWACRSVDS